MTRERFVFPARPAVGGAGRSHRPRWAATAARFARWMGGLWLLLLGGLTACSSMPRIDRQAVASEAIVVSDRSTLGRIALTSAPSRELSGFRLMPLGKFSLDTRVELARRAQVSLDVQYYHLENDESGRWLLRALRDAALRGVRVRLLIDDFYTSGHDELFLGLAAHPNVEVRLFNPFCCARDGGQLTRFLVSLNDFKRLNHRMHNKLFVADGAMAVIGGRNVANEYFLRNSMGLNFIDNDAFAVGWIIEPLQGLFDRYWNSEAVFPLTAVAHSASTPEELRAKFEDWTGPVKTPPPPPLPEADILGHGPIAQELDRGRLDLIWADAYVFADHPDKPFDGEVGGRVANTSVTFNLFEAIRRAEHEVVLSSPYLVPGEVGMDLLKGLRDRGVAVTALTNSLGSTDEPLVHLGYAKYRDRMLGLGVNIYEISGSRVKRNRRENLFGASLGRLHAKLAVIDKRWLFVGSKNLDPRSATINTELGVVIDSPALAQELLRVIEIDRLQNAYKLRLSPETGDCQWLGTEDGQEMVLSEEPDSTFWQRMKLRLLRPFVPESFL